MIEDGTVVSFEWRHPMERKPDDGQKVVFVAEYGLDYGFYDVEKMAFVTSDVPIPVEVVEAWAPADELVPE